ncbi:unnamed protein product [Lepeophtheirus salmonis]|uniref:(salmon louse) hypothetical protein n=1 Tax=Lepeophtheirus salmonis TaxID=72036 RepID=A0A7R8CR19_LEPSM|nr:unnamed protein product [Lepeophtheirus salmonis]CAF2901121.1 unnamed protein product [Lepeophtheirus salmonis]
MKKRRRKTLRHTLPKTRLQQKLNEKESPWLSFLLRSSVRRVFILRVCLFVLVVGVRRHCCELKRVENWKLVTSSLVHSCEAFKKEFTLEERLNNKSIILAITNTDIQNQSNNTNNIQLVNASASDINHQLDSSGTLQLSNSRLNPKNGDNSPESGSLYSDEIPSGYNSGEQYDTLSTGYMSGEAYELPETRMDIREPSLGKLAEEENELELLPQTALSSSDSENDRRDEIDSIRNHPDNDVNNPKSPTGNKLFQLMRPGKGLIKSSFSISMIEANKMDNPENTVGMYNAVPSDTDDTSAFESDANRAELLGDFKRRFGRRSRRHGGGAHSHSSNSKKMERDEEWFQHNDTKYWATARGYLFLGFNFLHFVCCILAAGIVIAQMPKTCDPTISWYQGIVNMELKALSSGITLTKIIQPKTLKFTQELHDHDINLIVEIPVIGDVANDKEYWIEAVLSLELQHTVANCIKFWVQRGVDGIILRGLNHFSSDTWIGDAVSDWRTVMAKYGTSSTNKILVTEVEFAEKIGDESLIKKMDLLDASLQIPESHFEMLSALEKMYNITSWDTSLEHPWINWNLKSVRPLSNAI